MSLPTSKVARAAALAGAGLRVGANYVKHAVQRAAGNGDAATQAANRTALDEANAAALFDTFSQLKGGPLKMAQVLGMDRTGLLPAAYRDRFAQAQYQSPPLSAPLVVKTFRAATGKAPSELFATFDLQATAAASIGQVHRASLAGRALAVKVQYPGVASSIRSDLNLLKPVAFRLLGLSEESFREYVDEVESKLIEETDYVLELRRSTEVATACAHLPHLRFAQYYPDLSGPRVLTMDWLAGLHLKEFLATNPSQAVRDQIGQALWDFYAYQAHTLRRVHADPHPGNFLFSEEDGGTVAVIDFGCVKEIPADFHDDFFAVVQPEVYLDVANLTAVLERLRILQPADPPETRAFILDTAQTLLPLAARPFLEPAFDFGDPAFQAAITAEAERLMAHPILRSQREPRGVRHFIYLNRAYFGLYTLLGDLRARIRQ